MDSGDHLLLLLLWVWAPTGPDLLGQAWYQGFRAVADRGGRLVYQDAPCVRLHRLPRDGVVGHSGDQGLRG